jgi:hypothetical protein
MDDTNEHFFDETETDRTPIHDLGNGPDKGYRQIDKELEQRHAYGEQVAKEHAKEALEELYASEFPVDDPPESFERYEAELTVRHMRQAIKGMFGVDDYVQPVEMDVTVLLGENDVDVDKTWAKVLSDADVLELTEHAKRMIDVMATYDTVAEPHIAGLTYASIPPEVREHAIETLGELRDDSDEPQSLREAIGRWLLPGGE